MTCAINLKVGQRYKIKGSVILFERHTNEFGDVPGRTLALHDATVTVLDKIERPQSGNPWYRVSAGEAVGWINSVSVVGRVEIEE